MPKYLTVLVIFILMLAARPLCGQNASEAVATADLASIALPPKLDRILRDYERAWREGDAVALASLFAEDGFILQNNRPPIRGRSAIQAAYEGQGGGPLRLRALAFDANGTVGYIIGAYGYDQVSNDIGKFTLTLILSPDDHWLIYSDMDNSNISSQREDPVDMNSLDE